MRSKLFEDAPSKPEVSSFRANPDFERRFNERKKREEVERLTAKFGDQAINDEDLSDSSSISEDEMGELDDEEMNLEFMKTLSKIKAKHPDIYNKETKFFDVDVETYATRSKGERGAPKLTARRMLAEGLAAGRAEESDEERPSARPGPTPAELQRKLKSEFLEAAGPAEEKAEAAESFEGGLLVKKTKSPGEQRKETADFAAFLASNTKRLKAEEQALVSRFWGSAGAPEEDANDRFLKNYILGQRWRDGADGAPPRLGEVDQEDEALDEKVDEFEHKYNFRFEEPGGQSLATHSRQVANTIRQEPSKRKEQREKELQRKDEKKEQLQRELDFLKQAKKDKIIERIAQLRKVSGASHPEFDRIVRESLENDFDLNYDRLMERLFGDQYYEQPEEDDGQVKEYLRAIEQDFDREFQPASGRDAPPKPAPESAELRQEREEGLIPTPSVPIHLKHNVTEPEAKALSGPLQSIWWFCDICLKGIQPLDSRFDCLVCPDHTECRACAQAKTHEHALKKFVVPEGCRPPADEVIGRLAAGFKYCSQCDEKLFEAEGYYQSKKDPAVFVCGGCIAFIGQGQRLRDFAEVRTEARRAAPGLPADPEQETLDELVADYRNLDFEDVIAGNIKTRFEYVDVQPQSFGLTDAELLFADDKLLNQMVSVKKLAPYRETGLTPKDREKIRKLRTLVKESAERNQKRFLSETELLRREQELKQQAKKSAKARREYETLLQEKEERLRQIYADTDPVIDKIQPRPRREEEGGRAEPEAVKPIPIAKNRLDSYGLAKKPKNN